MPARLSAGAISASAMRLRTRIAFVLRVEDEAARTRSTMRFASAIRSGMWCHCTAWPGRAEWWEEAGEYGTAPEAGSASRGRIEGKEALYQSTRPAWERKLVVSVSCSRANPNGVPAFAGTTAEFAGMTALSQAWRKS